ncbi:MAG TPA: efflux RND transporter permease subunit [Polyangiales bacterium]
MPLSAAAGARCDRSAGEARLVPILLTTLTAIGGLVPLVREHSSPHSPLALVLLGGLISSCC